MSRPLPPRQGLVAFMATLAGPQPYGFIELRHRRPGGAMRARFFDARKPNAAAMVATVLSQTGEVYVGCAPRSRREGCKQAVDRGWTLWVDCDDQTAIAALEAFGPQPAIVVRTSLRGLHAYWPLEQPLAAGEFERANRRLAHALQACQSAVTNAAAVLRPPATLNYKYEPPAPVVLERYTDERFVAAEVAGGLSDPPARRRLSPARVGPRMVKTDMLAPPQRSRRAMNSPYPPPSALLGVSFATTLGAHVDGVIRVVTLFTLLGTIVAYRRHQRRPGLDPFPIISRWSAVGLGLGVAIELLRAIS